MLSLVSEKEYNIIRTILKPIKMIYVEKGKVYEIESPQSKDRMFFRCIKSGDIFVKYSIRNGQDILCISGDGVLNPDDELTEGFNNVSK